MEEICIIPAHEPAKGYSRPILSGHSKIITEEVKKEHENFLAKRKFTLILRSKATSELVFSVDDTIHVLIKSQQNKYECGLILALSEFTIMHP